MMSHPFATRKCVTELAVVTRLSKLVAKVGSPTTGEAKVYSIEEHEWFSAKSAANIVASAAPKLWPRDIEEFSPGKRQAARVYNQLLNSRLAARAIVPIAPFFHVIATPRKSQ